MILLLTVSLIGQAHAKCKVESSTDPFTGVARAATSSSVGNSVFGELRIERTDAVSSSCRWWRGRRPKRASRLGPAPGSPWKVLR